MKIVFFGTPDYVVPILDKLHKTFRSRKGESPIAAVVTQKPAPTGREQKITYSAVDKWAHVHKISIFYSSADLLKEKVEADLGILAAYGEIISKEAISAFRHGILNVHPSILPKYRGASPVQAAILSGDKETGVSIIKMDEKVDHGPIISQFREEIKADDTTETLRLRLFENSAEVLVQLIAPYREGKITPRQQNHKEATFTKRITKEDGFIDLKKVDFPQAERFIRAMQPWPGAWTKLENGKRLKILKAHIEDEKLVLDLVQLEGKNPVSYDEFNRGYPTVAFTKD